MKKKTFLLITGIVLFLIVGLVWFYFPIHPQIVRNANPELSLYYGGEGPVTITGEQEEILYALIEDFSCQRRIFLFTKQYAREEDDLISVSITGEQPAQQPIHITISMKTPEDSYIIIGNSEYLLLNPERFIEAINTII